MIRGMTDVYRSSHHLYFMSSSFFLLLLFWRCWLTCSYYSESLTMVITVRSDSILPFFILIFTYFRLFCFSYVMHQLQDKESVFSTWLHGKQFFFLFSSPISFRSFFFKYFLSIESQIFRTFPSSIKFFVSM